MESHDTRQGAEKNGLGFSAYALGAASFIPVVGLVIGFIAILWGLARLKQGGLKIAVLGLMGIVVSAVVFGPKLYQKINEGRDMLFVGKEFFEDLGEELAKKALVDLVKEVEFYKLQYGVYPPELEVLLTNGEEPSFVMIEDPSKVGYGERSKVKFYYKLINEGENYHLFSIGKDGKAYTTDDMYPPLDGYEVDKLGYLQPGQDEIEGGG